MHLERVDLPGLKKTFNKSAPGFTLSPMRATTLPEAPGILSRDTATSEDGNFKIGYPAKPDALGHYYVPQDNMAGDDILTFSCWGVMGVPSYSSFSLEVEEAEVSPSLDHFFELMEEVGNE